MAVNRSLVINKMLEQVEKGSTSETLDRKLVPKFKHLSLLMASFENTINSRHPADTPELHVNRILKNGKSLAEKIQLISNEATDLAISKCQELNQAAKIRAKLVPGTESTNAEIRSVVREMKVPDKLNLLRQGEPLIIQALMDSNFLLHGVPEEELTRATNHILRTAAPKEMAEFDELVEFTGTIDRMKNLCDEGVLAATENSHVRDVLNKAKGSEAVHDEFISQLNDVLPG